MKFKRKKKTEYMSSNKDIKIKQLQLSIQCKTGYFNIYIYPQICNICHKLKVFEGKETYV